MKVSLSISNTRSVIKCNYHIINLE